MMALSEVLTVVFAVHPRTAKRLKKHGLLETLSASDRIRLAEPLSYLEFMSLVTGCFRAQPCGRIPNAQ
jgi:UDP-N-acetylglucosamine 2-epimerase